LDGVAFVDDDMKGEIKRFGDVRIGCWERVVVNESIEFNSIGRLFEYKKLL
jgi:hypothetical protein